MNVMANMNMQIAPTIRPVRMFLRASRLVIMGGEITSYGRPARDLSVAFQAPIS
jgi:hypothetical protein